MSSLSKEQWAEFFLDIIENKRSAVDISNLSLQDVASIDWNILPKCTSITNLSMNTFPSTQKQYQPYLDYAEWFCKPPTHTQQEIESLFPPQIFQMTQLKVLKLQNYPFSYLSPNISKLTQLQELYIEGSPIICFPETIGKLKKLTTLKFYCSRRMKYAPYELSHCTSLRQTTAGTSRLYVNEKNNLLLPPLPKTQPELMGHVIRCIVEADKERVFTVDLARMIIEYLPYDTCSNEGCEQRIYFKECIYYGWSRQNPGSDTLCLLAKMCSPKCLQSMPKGTRHYLGKTVSSDDDDGKYSNVKVTDNGEISYKRKSWYGEFG